MRWSRRHLYCEIYRVISVSYNWGKDSCTLTTSIVYIAFHSEKRKKKCKFIIIVVSVSCGVNELIQAHSNQNYNKIF